MNIADLYNVIMQNYMKLLIGRNKKAAVRGARPNDGKAEEYAIPLPPLNITDSWRKVKMEKLIVIRDCVFWWTGVWALITLADAAIYRTVQHFRSQFRDKTPVRFHGVKPQFYDQEADSSNIGDAQ